MADCHDLAVLRPRADLERLGDARGGERVVAAGLERAREPGEEAAAVVVDRARLPVHETLGGTDVASERLDDHLVTEADAERGDAVTETLDDLEARSGIARAAGTGGDDEVARRQALGAVGVDLGRNDLSRVCRAGTVRVGRFLEPERYSHVTHLVSEVTGELLPDFTPFDLLRACFPAGTVSGAPKVRAMQLISELEGYRRGPYAGAVGYALPDGGLDTCIAIRTIVLADGVAHLQAGAGIVADSDPTAEHEECLRKLAALEAAIELAEQNGSAP